jgi:hypothetical protein
VRITRPGHNAPVAWQAGSTPSSGRLGKVNVTVAAVGGSGDSPFVVFDTTGATIDELLKSPPEGSADSSRQGALEIRVFDPHGKQLKLLASGGAHRRR